MEPGIHELTAGYALDALDADERAAYEAHLAGCETCQRSSRSFWETTEALAVAASGPAPSDGAARANPRGRPRSERRRTSCRSSRGGVALRPCSGAVAAVAAVVALGIGLWGANVSSKLDDTRSALERRSARRRGARRPRRAVGRSPGRRMGVLVVGADGPARPRRRRPRSRTRREDVRDVDHSRWEHRGGEPAPASSPDATGLTIVALDGTVRAATSSASPSSRRAASDSPTTRSDRRIGHRSEPSLCGRLWLAELELSPLRVRKRRATPHPRRRVRKRRLAALLLVLFVAAALSFTFGLVRAVASEIPTLDPAAQHADVDTVVYASNGKTRARRASRRREPRARRHRGHRADHAAGDRLGRGSALLRAQRRRRARHRARALGRTSASRASSRVARRSRSSSSRTRTSATSRRSRARSARPRSPGSSSSAGARTGSSPRT